MVLLDGLNTRNLSARKNFNLPSYSCATLQCSQEETLIHLFWDCTFAMKCWDYICPQRTLHLSVMDAFYDVKNKLNVSFAMEIIIAAAWRIWILRNTNIFKNQLPTFQSWKVIFKNELRIIQYRIKKKFAETFNEWIQNQV
jgi:hypothetical protein